MLTGRMINDHGFGNIAHSALITSSDKPVSSPPAFPLHSAFFCHDVNVLGSWIIFLSPNTIHDHDGESIHESHTHGARALWPIVDAFIELG